MFWAIFIESSQGNLHTFPPDGVGCTELPPAGTTWGSNGNISQLEHCQDYRYTVRSFTGDASDGIAYVENSEFWDGYKFVIITTRSIGQTSTFDIQNGANRPGWIDATVPDPNDPNKRISYVVLQFRSEGRQFLPCSVASNTAYLSGS